MELELTHGSTFSGIGGFELGAEYAGIKTLWNCEIEPFQRSILKKNFKNAQQFTDIKTLINAPYVDIISGGFPCQDISIANVSNKEIKENEELLGINGKRSGLWSEMHRVIDEVRPRYAIIENSPMLIIRGLERILYDLHKIGYNAEWQCLSAETFGFPHKRERIYLIAYTNQNRRHEIEIQESIFNKKIPKASGREFSRTVSREILSKDHPEFLRIDDGLPSQLDVNRIESMGNAVIPQIAHYLFDCVKIHNYKIQKQLNGKI